MKHKTTVIVSLLVAVGITAGSAVSYSHYRKWQKEQTAIQVAAQQKEAKSVAAQNEALQTEINAVDQTCAQEYVVFNSLPISERTKVVPPKCIIN